MERGEAQVRAGEAAGEVVRVMVAGAAKVAGGVEEREAETGAEVGAAALEVEAEAAMVAGAE